MKLRTHISRARNAGISLIECLVYLAVFSILLGGATAAFYFCWDHTRAVIYATNDIESALRAGETWRADVRAATGKISIELDSTNQIVKIPENQNEIVYRLTAGELRREIPEQNISRVLLDKVKSSQMQTDPRGNVAAWRWELELMQRRRETQMPLLFTFEAAAKNSP